MSKTQTIPTENLLRSGVLTFLMSMLNKKKNVVNEFMRRIFMRTTNKHILQLTRHEIIY